ncbi:sulfotransferase-like domain-containing protein [Wenzhouxiangella sp. EGI_FJ10409]|uniref:sulfotransferase-like domain-containing protein n=1 Tax=Wenzhouxiangella sp. EGI_FJ10409 TaxID=3243767 RepID=UPI0035D80FAD
MPEPLRIAMWSGPRNISTAMMRAFENRPDCAVSDEPLYGAWLKLSGAPHPMREEVIAAMDSDWQSVVETLTGPAPDGASVWYQKHMTHHILPEMMDAGWLSKLTHVFLIRDPRHVVASYLGKRDTVSPEDIGVPQQQAIYDFIVGRLGREPPIIDSGEFLAEPEGHLRALCERLDIAFGPEMLSWPAGPRESDGVWAPHWYQKVWESTGFGPPPGNAPDLEGRARTVAAACRPMYEQLYSLRLRPRASAI